MELTGKTAVVTGASGGLGGEIAVGLARAGCDVIVHYNRNLQGAERTALMVRQAGRKAAIAQADLRELLCDEVRGNAPKTGAMSRESSVLSQEFEEQNPRVNSLASCMEVQAKLGELFAPRAGFGEVRILVNSAAIFGRTPVGSIGIEEASKIVEMNLLVPILLIQEFHKFLNQLSVVSRQSSAGEEKEPWGKIVNIADVGGERPWKGYSVYCAAKAGLIAATKSLAKELAPGVTVNAVAPGLVTWPEGMDEAGKARQLGFIPAGRVARAEEVAATVVFLLQNDYITGQVINVDGGRSA